MSLEERDPMRSYRWRKLAQQVLREETVCWMCGQPIDFNAPPWTRYAPSVDHIVPRSLGGNVWDRRNLRAAHFGHNSARGNGTKPGSKGATRVNSRRW